MNGCLLRSLVRNQVEHEKRNSVILKIEILTLYRVLTHRRFGNAAFFRVQDHEEGSIAETSVR